MIRFFQTASGRQADVMENGQHRIYDIEEQVEDAQTAAGMINYILRQALLCRASDIHLEPRTEYLLVKFRCDGQLREEQRVKGVMQQLILNRIKVMAEMDITEKRLPQDGHLAVLWQNQKFDLRISSLPLFQGEKMVLRILGQQEIMLEIEQLGFSEENLEKVQRLLQIPHGMILVCGPTGSGKTTTLYSMLDSLRKKGSNIITLEDPVEYEMQGINQVQINEKTGLTFARGLRSILRQDPDIIMVGEIRDLESAEIAIRLAYTGHLVLASLHTSNALGAIKRLVEMGVASHLLASCLNGVVAQRLVRRCAEGNMQGRLAIQEVMLCDDTFRQLLSQYEVFLQRQQAVLAGFVSLVEDGKRKVEEGRTTMEELIAVVGPQL